VKSERSRGEYCWTLTPFVYPAVFSRAPSIKRVTYLDADLFFFAPPSLLLNELDRSRKHVLITDHAYDPEYDQSAANGRFCVQFLTCNNTQEAALVYHWWAERCLEWCFNRPEDGKFGDQKYLDTWPELFGDKVHILEHVELTLAPWNHTSKSRIGKLPVLYHFHSLRIVSQDRVRLYDGYRLGSSVSHIYGEYLKALETVKNNLADVGLPFATLPEANANLSFYRKIRKRLGRRTKYIRLKT
jgi:hypothetical protein